MKFLSTRGKSPAVTFSEALQAGLASDGGLYFPERFPSFTVEDFDGLDALPEVAARLLAPFLEGDALEEELPEVCESAFSFPAPLKPLARETWVLELFHGPTAAFKDFGARFLAECMSRLRKPSDPVSTVIVATSGDTGGAVAGAFHGLPGFEVVILYPKGRISARQEKQLNAWGGNVRAFAVRGAFDDCQRMVKTALANSAWQSRHHLISANSISVGRLLPQMAYYARASLELLRSTGRVPGVIVPTGNLGNAVAALWAKRCGLPIREVVLATNANRPLADWFATGQWKAQPTVTTLANAMDVGNPSNVERLFQLYPDETALRRDVRVVSSGDAEISAAIGRGPREWGEIWCPHTACAVIARETLGGPDWILTATAHPAKFDTIVEPLVGSTVPVPPELDRLLGQPSNYREIDADLAQLENALA